MHKKEDKTFIKNYHPISLISIFGKTFKKVIYSCLFNHFLSNNIFTPFKLDFFFPGDSCTAQFLSIIHEIQNSFWKKSHAVEGELHSQLQSYWSKDYAKRMQSNNSSYNLTFSKSSRNALLTIYKSFIRVLLDYDYGDILHDKSLNEFIWMNVDEMCRWTSGWIYDELGLNSLVGRHQRNKLVFLNKIVNCLLADYLYSYLDFSFQENLLLRSSSTYDKASSKNNKILQQEIFSYCINEWNKVT